MAVGINLDRHSCRNSRNLVTVTLMHEWLTVFWDGRIIANSGLNYLCLCVYKYENMFAHKMEGNISIQCSIEPLVCVFQRAAFFVLIRGSYA